MTKRTALIATAVAAAVAVPSASAATLLVYSGQSWHEFSGTGRLGQVWSPSMVSVSGSTLTEKISGNVAGGVGSTTWKLYGKYTCQFKFSPGAGKMVILLKGHEGTPYNELDIAESKVGDSGRTKITATRHWGVGRANMLQHSVLGDFTQWHTVSVTWTSTAMVVSMDGKVFANYTAHVSHTPMDMAIQTAGANVAGAGIPAALQVKGLTVS